MKITLRIKVTSKIKTATKMKIATPAATQNQLKSKIAVRAPQNVQWGLGLVNPRLLGATNNFCKIVFLI